MSGVNKVILVGRLGKDPDVKHLTNGQVVANFSMATSESYKDKQTGEKKEITDWHNIVLWRGLAEIAQKYLHKGDLIYIEGKLRTRSWEQGGVTKYMTEIIGDNMTMLVTGGTRTGSGPSTRDAPPQSPPPTHGGDSSDDLPF